MPSTYSPLLRLELMAVGEKTNTWGNTTNTNLGTLLENSISGFVVLDVTSSDVTLTAVNGADDQARCAILRVIGSPGAPRNIVAPGTSKTYVVHNGSNAAVTLKAAATTGVAIAAGETALAIWNGLDFVRTSVVTATLAAKASTLAQGGGNGTAMTFDWAGQVGSPSYVWGSNDGVTVQAYAPSNFLVNSATLATKASTLAQGGGNGAAMTFFWNGQSGQPTWLWGGTDGVNHYIYNPANFAVASASTAATATLATKASTLAQGGGNGAAMTFNWSGQGGQPTWLWGGTDGINHYVFNPANFNVNYATSAGTATTATALSATNPCVFATYPGAFTRTTGGTWDVFTFSSEVFDAGSNFNGATFTVPANGVYEIVCSSMVSAVSTVVIGFVNVWIDGVARGSANGATSVAPDDPHTATGRYINFLTTGQAITIRILHTGSGNCYFQATSVSIKRIQ